MQHLWTLGFAAFALAIYAIWIRPTLRNLPHFKEFYDAADSRWARIAIRVRETWDLLVAQLLILVPEVPGLLQQLMTQDISAIVPGDKAKAISQWIAIGYIVSRALIVASTKPK